jgi:hypothetical protein
LLDSGCWPRTYEEALKQNLKSPASKERIQLFAPEESTIFLYTPPFYTVAADIAGRQKRGHHTFWSTYAALDSISPELSLVIGEFGGIGCSHPARLSTIRLEYARDPITVAQTRGQCLGTLR